MTPALGVVVGEDLAHLRQILLRIGDEDRSVEHVVAQRLGDLALAAATDRAGLVAERALAGGADQAPARRARVLLEPHLPAPGRHINVIRLEWNRPLLPVRSRPPDLLAVDAGARGFGNVDELRKPLVDAVAFRANVDECRIIARDVRERPPGAQAAAAGAVLRAQAPAWKRQRAAGVLLLDVAVEVRGVADLRLHFLLAITVVIVRDERDDHARRGAARELEGRAVVVLFSRVAPAHAVAPLALCCLVEVRQAELL